MSVKHVKDNMNRRFWLEQIIKEKKFKVGAELGILRGPTFRHLIENCQDLTLHGVDVFYDDRVWKKAGISTTEKLLELEPVPWYNELLEFCESFSPRAHIIRNFTALAAKSFDNESLDFVFIDADHSYAGVKKDIDAWWPKVRNGGMVSGHDIDMPEVRKAVEEEFGGSILAGKSILGYSIATDNVWYMFKH